MSSVSIYGMFHSMSVHASGTEKWRNTLADNMEKYLENYNIATVLRQWSCFWGTNIKKVIIQKKKESCIKMPFTVLSAVLKEIEMFYGRRTVQSILAE